MLWSIFTNHNTYFGRGAYIIFFISIIYFIKKFIQDTIFLDNYDNNILRIKVLFKYYLFTISIYFVFNVFLTHNISVGIPFGHAGDFFHILNLSYINNYSEISQIGYLPGLLAITKSISLLFMKKEGLIDINLYSWMLYFGIFLSSLYIVCLPVIKADNLKMGLPVYFIFITSYPFILEIERGNFVILTMIFLSLSIQLYHTQWTGIFIGIFSSLKLLNIVFLPSFLLSRKISFKITMISILLFGLVFPLVLLYLTGSKIDYSGLFNVATTSGTFPDAHVAVAHSGAYSTLTLLQNSGMFSHIDRHNFINKSIILLIIFIIIYYTLELYYFFLKNKVFLKKDLCFSLIAIFMLTKFFHQNNTDMNLILLFPIMIQLFFEKLTYIENLIFSLLLLLLFPFYVLILFGVQDSNVVFYYSARTLVYALIFITIAILSFIRFRDISNRT